MTSTAQSKASSLRALALPAPRHARHPETVTELSILTDEEFAAKTSAMRKDLLDSAREHALSETGQGRQAAVRISAMKKISSDLVEPGFVGPEVAGFDRRVMQTVAFGTDGDREMAKKLSDATLGRHQDHMRSLSYHISVPGLHLHEVISLKNDAWFEAEGRTDPAYTPGIPRKTRAELLAEATKNTRHPSATAALRHHGGLGVSNGARLSEGYLILATPADKDISEKQYHDAMREGTPAALKKIGLTAVAAKDPYAARDLLVEQRHRQARKTNVSER